MKYELNKIYTACAETPTGPYRIYFTFSESHIEPDMHCVSIRTDPRYPYEHVHFASDATICYSSPAGNWFMTAHKEQYPTWVFKRGVYVCTPEVLEVGMKGKHYNAMIEDDMADAFAYSTTEKKDVDKEVKQAVDWHKMMEEGEKKMKEDFDKHYFDLPLVPAKRGRMGIITNITEGGNEMHKELYHVILFNRKTEEIDFKEYIPAQDEEAAAMTAVQAYGEYDANIHKHLVKLIEGSDYEVIK